MEGGERRAETAGREYQTLFFVVTPRNAAACDTLGQKVQTRSPTRMFKLANVTDPSMWARAYYTNLDIHAKWEVLPAFFDIVKTQPTLRWVSIAR
jgi:hypothetical protein